MTKRIEMNRKSGDRPALELVITKEMIEAGAQIIDDQTDVHQSAEQLALEVFSAMIASTHKLDQ